jgi:hypothetical protein
MGHPINLVLTQKNVAHKIKSHRVAQAQGLAGLTPEPALVDSKPQFIAICSL